MNISSVHKEQCTGCTACRTVCPTACITFRHDEEGFFYPKVDESTCIDCSVCITACPAVHKDRLFQPLYAIAASGKDKSLIWNSSSGGAFYLLARYILSINGYVCGAVLSDDLKLCHVLSNRIDEIEAMRGSKYIQSDLKQCFKTIVQLVKEGNPVLFSGTPCQVAGLRKVVKSGEENLYTVDLICHGVPSSRAFAYYMNKMYGAGVYSNFTFRKKDKHLFMDYAYSWGGTGKKVDFTEEPFYQAFMDGVNYRMSCYQCQYACAKRVGDITVGDCANARAYPMLDGKPISTILINTEKGKILWDKISKDFEYVNADYMSEVRANGQLNHPARLTKRRDIFYVDIENLSNQELKKKYCKKKTVRSLVKDWVIWHTTPSQRAKLRRIRGHEGKDRIE